MATGMTRESRLHADRAADQRDPFQRDRDRILYTSAFRRLADVTQVVQAVEGPVFHNRLTHSLKVAQIGQRLAEHLRSPQGPGSDIIDAVGGIHPEVVEAAALAHDLGHPPFGHVAEAELDQCLSKKGIHDGYEGNAQSFRIVTKVAIHGPNHKGLNLTCATLNAILKYPWSRRTGGKEHRKWGYYHDDKEDFEAARSILLEADSRRSAEAELMDWADDVTYAVHDADDFYRVGLIPLDRLLLADGKERPYFFKRIKALAMGEGVGAVKFSEDNVNATFDNIAEYANLHPELGRPFSGSREQRVGLDFLASQLIRRFVTGVPGTPAVSLNAAP